MERTDVIPFPKREHQRLSDEDGVAFLRAIERGETCLTTGVDTRLVENDRVIEYVGWGGRFDEWKIAVSVLDRDFDFIVWMRSSDGRSAEYEDFDTMPETDRFVPSEEMTWVGYGLPGESRSDTEPWNGCLRAIDCTEVE